MILDPNEINALNFDEKFNELVEHGTSTYKFLLKVLDNDLNEYQFDRLRSYIIDRFIRLSGKIIDTAHNSFFYGFYITFTQIVLGNPAMRFQGANSCNEHHCIGLDSRLAAFNI